MKMVFRAFCATLALCLALPAFAQSYQDSGGTAVQGFVPIQPGVGPLFTNSNPGKISGTFSATLSGFQPTPSYSQLAASDTSNHSVATPSGADDVISNLDTNVAYCNFGAASTTNTFPIAGGSTAAFHNGAAFSTIQCQSPTSTLKITISGGAGLFTGAGGGGGGGSGSNASVGVINATAPTSAMYNGMSISGGNLVGAAGSVWGSAPTGLNVFGVNANVLSAPATLASSANQEVTAAGVSATSAQGMQGVTGGVPLPISGATDQGNPQPATNPWPVYEVVGTAAVAAANPFPVSFGNGVTLPAFTATPTFNLGTIGTAASAANQTAVQSTPGTPQTTALTVQGNSSGIAIPILCTNCGAGGGGATPQTTAGVDVNLSTAATTQLVGLVSGQYIYVTAYDFVASGVTNVSLVYGTGTNCATGTTTIWGPIALTAQSGEVKGSGLGVVIPPTAIGTALCFVSSAAVQVGGSLNYTQSSTVPSTFGGSGGTGAFVSNGSRITNSSVATSSTNAALTGSPAAVLVNNIGTVPIEISAVSTSGGTVSGTTADLIVPANSVMELGTNGLGFVAYAAIGGTGSVQISEGTGLFTGAGGGGGGGSGGNVTITSPLGPSTATSSAVAVTMTGTPITGQTLGSGGQGVIGWLSQVVSAMSSGVFTPGGSLPTQGVVTGGVDINSLPQQVPIDPCTQPKSYFDLSTTTGTATQLVAGVSGKKIYICAGTSVVTSAAAHVSFVEGTGSTCTTPTSVWGNTGTVAAASGMAFAANGGMQLTGMTPAATQTAAHSLCLLFDTTNSPTVNAHVVYVQE